MGQQEVGNQSKADRPGASCIRYFLATAVLLLGNLATIPMAAVAMAASTDASETDSFERGEVTGKRERALLINNKEYSVLTDVTVKDTASTSRALSDVVPGMEVRFHLRQGRIDQIIIILPS